MVTLHEEIRDILLEHGREMTTSEIAREVNRRGNYHKRDDSAVTAYQVHGRTKNYDSLFTRQGVTVGLQEWTSPNVGALQEAGSTAPAVSDARSRAARCPTIEEPPSSELREALPAVADEHARVLVLGTMPGSDSHRLREYYANPRNQFWPILFATFGFAPAQGYGEKKSFLLQHGIALWDVLQACAREGSLDVDIVRGSERPNAVAALLRAHPRISVIALNGGRAHGLFQRLIAPSLASLERKLRAIQLPSTSPAHTMGFARKLEDWRKVLAGEAA